MAWGYRLESMGSRSAARHRQALRSCAVGTCQAFPAYVSSYKYARAEFEAVLREAGFGSVAAWTIDDGAYWVFFAS